MANKRPKPEEIVSKLRQVEVLMGQGMSRLDAIRQIGVVEQTYYRWRKKYGGMGVDQLKELKRLQKENERLRRAVSDLTLDKLILTEAARFPGRASEPDPNSPWRAGIWCRRTGTPMRFPPGDIEQSACSLRAISLSGHIWRQTGRSKEAAGSGREVRW